MTRRYGIDTSILVRLLTGDPAEGFELCVARLTDLVDHEVFASNQVIGEAYVAVQHHYGVSKQAAREGLASVLLSGLVKPWRGQAVVESLADRPPAGCGLLDRLIVIDHDEAGLRTLTLDRRMARLPGAELLT
jgi:predicted nucleic acid-binding protein